MLDPFHLQRVNKLYGKYKPVRITKQKEHLLIWNSETTQKVNIYLHSYQTETAIFPYRKYIKTAKNDGFYEKLLSENDFEAVLVNFYCYEYGANASEAVQKHMDTAGVANSLNS